MDVEAFVTSALAVVRTGMVLVPVDPGAPVERAAAIVDEVGAAVVLSDVAGDGDVMTAPVVDPTGYETDPADVIPDLEGAAGVPAVVSFTSGSTGLPKGIMIAADQREATGRWASESYADGMRAGMLAAGSIPAAESFVHSAMYVAATIVTYDLLRLGLGPLASWLRDQRVEAFGAVPTLLRSFLSTLDADEHFPDLRLVSLSGEGLSWEEVAQLRRHLPEGAQVRNLYAMTEAGSIASMVVDAGTAVGSGLVPAGRPIAGCRIEIVDEEGRPVPDGEPGEIVVDGHVGLGYWARPDLTAAVFTVLEDGTRRCRTGDQGRFRPDGLLEHLGRLDHVVKVSGNRIDLGEAESVLRSLEGVAAAAVTAVPDPNRDLRLHAYVVPAGGAEVDPQALRRGLARRLPGYMLPRTIVVLDELPMLPNGKVDRLQLPEPSTARPLLGAEMTAPDRSVEVTLAAIWAEVLGFDEVGVDDDFFELGGDSLRGARIFAEIERRLGVVRPMSLMLEAPTVAGLARALFDDGSADPLVPIQVDGTRLPLFVVHGGGGEVWFAHDIATHLGDDQPVYALQPGIRPGAPLGDLTLADLAARYVASIRRLRPHGPYLLFGYSLGGMIAFEIARQLQDAGHAIALLAMGDSPAPQTVVALRSVARRASSHAQDLRALPPTGAAGEAWARVWRSARFRYRRKVKRWHMEPDARRRGDHAMYELAKLALSYAPTGTFEGSVVLIRSRSAVGQRGWATFVAGEVRVAPVAGSHTELVHEPCVGDVSRILRAELDAVLASV
jgi:acyl-coenzyme A synthetase/AMP-(fatty) acid ligase/thioesterase domain-containing protein/acyl carrier protein